MNLASTAICHPDSGAAKMGKQHWARSGLLRFAGLAEDALKALEAQTKEAARLRAHAASQEEALKAKEGQLAEAVRRQAVLEDAIGDRDSQVLTQPVLL